MEFVGIIHKDDKSDFGVSFPDFPGCFSAGSSMQEAKNMAASALQSHIDLCTELNQPIPYAAMSLDAAAQHQAAKNAAAFITVNARLPGRTRRINISLDENIIRQIDNVSTNRSAFLASAALERLRLNEERPQA